MSEVIDNNIPAPVDNAQASLPLTVMVQALGIFPVRDGDSQADPGAIPLGSLRFFAGDFDWGGAYDANGELVSISQNTALFSIIGTYYGGNGTNNFAMPDLDSGIAIGMGQGSGLTNRIVGEADGERAITLQQTNLPVARGGAGQSFDNLTASVAINYLISSGAAFNSTGDDMPGEILPFLGNFAPEGYLEADGSLLNIAEYPALFSRIGTIYGGNGSTTFRLPDLRGRALIGASATDSIGSMVGQEQDTVATANLPTGMGGLGAALDNRQPSVAINYIIALQGIYPTQDGNPTSTDGTPTLGEVIPYAGAYIPNGWALCDGSLLPISQNTALFSLLGTNFGGNGQTTFALPDLRDLTLAGSDGTHYVGSGSFGSNSITLTADQVPIPSQPVNHDFDGNGATDILWQNTSGQALIWLMDGTVKLEGSGNAGPALGTSWTIRGSGDFNDDGRSDIVWQKSSGQIAIWEMNGTTKTGGGTLSTSPSAAWTVRAVGDFNEDGKSDLVLQNSNGQIAIWLMDGTSRLAGSGGVGNNLAATWHVVGAGDFNGDGKADILMRNDNGQIAIWLMDGTNKLAGSGAISLQPGAAWQVKGVGDFNGDGNADILLENSSGQAAVYMMNGTAVLPGSGQVGTSPGAVWQASVTDINDDGKADILWQDNTGQNRVWLMNGASITSHVTLANSPGAAWHVMTA